MALLYHLTLIGLVSPGLVAATVAVPTPEQLAWQDLEVGVMLGFNLQSDCIFGAGATTQRCQDTASGFVPTPATVTQWDPYQIDVEQWIQIASSFGAKYIVLVADHMTGFTLWDTKAHNFSIANTRWRNGGQDLVQQFLTACKAHNIKPGFFYSAHYNWYLGVNEFKVGWPPLGGVSYTQEQYNTIAAAQLKEILEMSDDWAEVWFDGGVDTTLNPAMGPIVQQYGRRLMCHSCVNFTQDTNDPSKGYGIRWMGNEEGVMPLPSWGASDGSTTGSPTAPYFMPPSTDTVLRNHYWFWKKDTENTLRSTKELVSVYLTSVGRASNLILNVGPNSTGAVPDVDVQRYAEMGAALACLFRTELYHTPVAPSTVNNTVTIDLQAQPVTARNLSLWLLEDQTAGQLINTWTLLLQFSNSSAYYPVHTDTGIGHKRILSLELAPGTGNSGGDVIRLHSVPATVAVVGLRVSVTAAFAAAGGQLPQLRSVRLFNWDNTTACV